MNRYYFDWAATTKISENALATYNEVAKKFWANPSGIYKESKAATEFLKEQRELTAKLLNVETDEIIYTSGATEANSIIMNSLLWKRTKGEVVFNSLEHNSILEHANFLKHNNFKVVNLKSNKGYIDLNKLEAKLNSNTQLLSLILVSNIFGTVIDVREVANRIRKAQDKYNNKIHLHCDATQAVGKLKFDLYQLGVDSATFSAHKFQGPNGIGILFLKDKNLKSLSIGGGQEMGFRAGTENLASIAAMNVALKESLENLEKNKLKALELRKLLEFRLKSVSNIRFLSPSIEDFSKEIVPSIFNFSVKTLPSEVLVRLLDDLGFAVSSGSACSSNTSAKKMKVYLDSSFSLEEAQGAIRVSFGPSTTVEQINNLADAIIEVVAKQTTLLRRR
jgi:cysteine desulfurase